MNLNLKALKRRIVLLLVIASFWSCKMQHEVAMLDLSKIARRDYDLSRSAQKMRYLSLQNETGDFSGYLTGFVDAGKYYYVTDNYSLLKYTKTGKYISSIGNWGIEAGQDGIIYCMDMDAEKDRLYVRTVDEMFVFDAEGKLLKRQFLDIPPKAHYDPEKQVLLVRKDSAFHRRFYLSAFYLNERNQFLFKNPDNEGNEVAVLICNEELDSIGAIRNGNPRNTEVYDVIPRISTDRNYYYYLKTGSDTLYQLNQQLQEKPFLVLRHFYTPSIYATRHILYIKGNGYAVLYSSKSGKAIHPGKGKNSGIYIEQIPWKPVAGKGNRLFLQALATDVMERKGHIKNPALKRLCETLTPESGVVLIDLKINKLKP